MWLGFKVSGDSGTWKFGFKVKGVRIVGFGLSEYGA